MRTQVCTIVITVKDVNDHYNEEDWVKQIWPYMQPWFTRRHGIENGRIILGDGGVEVSWRYETNEPPESEAELDQYAHAGKP